MFTNNAFMIPIKSKSIEKVIKSYLKDVYSVFGGNKYILSDRGGNFTSKQSAWLVKNCDLSKYILLLIIPWGISVIEHTHPFLKASIRKLISNHNTDWNELAHEAMLAYNVS